MSLAISRTTDLQLLVSLPFTTGYENHLSLITKKKKTYDVRKIENPFQLLCSKITPCSFISNQSAYKICRLWNFSSTDPGSCSQGPNPKKSQRHITYPWTLPPPQISCSKSWSFLPDPLTQFLEKGIQILASIKIIQGVC